MVKRITLVLLFAFLTISTVHADEYVSGYTRSDGTYVSGYYRSSPNDTVTDNYSYEGNHNPYTGTEGSKHYKSSPSSEYYDTSSGSLSDLGSYRLRTNR